MGKTLLRMCAGAWLAALVGCASSDVAGLLLFQGPGDDRMVVGSLESVATATHKKLLSLQLAAEMTQKGEAYYIKSALDSERRFTLVLTSEKDGDTERTRIRMEWEGKRDGALSLHILSLLENPK